jgi:hypothetical protein
LKRSKAINEHRKSRKALFAVLGLVVVGGLYLAIRNTQPTVESFKPAEPQGAKDTRSSPTSPVVASKTPPYHESAEAAKPFPQLLPAAYFRNNPLAARAYQLASEIPEVLAQQPCYCYCDKYGHKSLLDCYASDHAAG